MSVKISGMTAMTTPADNDVLPIVDVSASQTKKITVQNLKGPTSTQTSDYTIDQDGEKVFASGTLTITLAPASNAWTEKICNIGTGRVTIQCAGSDTIEGQASIILSGQYESVTLHSNGGALWVEF